ncbi:L-threonine dehydratase catabolic TdcB [Nematostella vectensis]|uniref:L-threonine dehydratase catabolic TdcB n=1 Tax=Nematostella vectensis TaxID=45351 RepID=UPI002076D8DB|nr:L-threonine dehydratase catabolic TdcB [Nematostella vectensis]
MYHREPIYLNNENTQATGSMENNNMKDRIEKATQRIRPYVRHTPMDLSFWLSSEGKAQVYIKWESEQVTGSFKSRGAFNYLLSIRDKSIGAVTASTGNHGAACANAMKVLGMKGKVYCPEYSTSAKREAIEANGAEVIICGKDCVDTEMKARADAKECGAVYVPPYAHLDVMAGQATVGVEVFEDLPSVDAVFVSVGGGGLVGGIGAHLKQVKPDVQVIGCQPKNSCVMWESIKAGRILDLPSEETLSDGTAGGIEQESPTFEMCKKFVDDWVLVSEEEISKAIYDVMDYHHKLIEGAAAVSVAAYLKIKERFVGKTVVIIACGGNVDMAVVKRVIKENAGDM